jgi:phage protein D
MYNFIDINLPLADTKTIFSYRTILSMGRYQHQHLTMYVKNWDINYSDVKAGAPIQVTITSPYGSQEFAGYIHSVTPDLSPGKQFVEVTALGSTYVMKQASQRVWSSVTADQVISEICTKYNHAYHATPYPRVYDNLLQAGETDWEFMCKLAVQSGYTLRPEGTAIYFDPITQDFTDNQANAPYFVMRQANDPKGLSMYKFTPEIGEANTYDGQTKAAVAVGGIDLSSASSIVTTNQTRPATTRTVSDTEFFDRFHTSAVIPNAQVATYESIAADERNRYPYRGDAQVLGDARIKPDMPVFLDGIGASYSGYWTVIECQHIFTERMYTTEMTVGTDSLGQVAAGAKAPASVPNRVISPVSLSKKAPAPSTLIKNTPTVNNATKNSGFTLAKNRKQPTSAASAATQSPKWGNASTNLRVTQAKNSATPATIAKLRSQGVR